MNVLILTCNTGGGHNAAARAIAEELTARGIENRTENALQFAGPIEESIIVGGHSFAYKYAPKVFEAGYRYAEDHTSYPVYLNSAKYAPIMKRFIERGGWDTVISVHVSPGHAMTRIRRRYRLPVKQYFVATDYTCSPGYELVEADRIFIPQGMTREFVRQGMDPGMLLETGIPVRTACYEDVDRAFVREQLFREVPVAASEKMVLVGPGCLAPEEVDELARDVSLEVPEAVFVVLCGKGNSPYRRRLTQLENPAVRPLGYTMSMDLWMKAADLLITKPGGLTSTEAVSCGVPVILLDVAPGLETHNRDYYVNRGCASSATGVPALFGECVRLLTDDETTGAMRANQRRLFSRVAVRELVDEVVRQDAERVAAGPDWVPPIAESSPLALALAAADSPLAAALASLTEE